MRNYFSCSHLFTNDLFLSKKCSTRHCQQMEREKLAGAGMQGTCRSKTQKTAGSTEEEGKHILTVAITKPPQGLAVKAGTYCALCGIGNSLLHRTQSTSSSFLWRHSRTKMAEDWACPIRETLLQNPAEQQNPEVRKWRCVTWWG